MSLNAQLEDVVDDKNNNFNLLRFGAAVAVIVSHSFILTNNMPNSWPKILGFFAVNCFFVISGFLVCKSLLQRNSIKRFVWARALRIYPALLLAVLFCALVIGPFYTTLPLADYFTNSLTYQFIFTNGTLIGNGVVNKLPGVFSNTDNIVNAPLWTLFYEAYMYIALAILAFICGISSRLNVALLTKVIIVISGVLFLIFVFDIRYKYLQNHFISSMVRFGSLFGIGVSLYLIRSKIKLNVLAMVIAIFLILLSSLNRFAFNSITYFLLGYILLYLAFIPKGFLLSFNRLGDYSYGLYIFAYPIQQSLVHSHPTIGTTALLLSSLVLSLIFAVISWHLLEVKMLKMKI